MSKNTGNQVVIKSAVNCLFHAPGLIPFGSKPIREIKEGRMSFEKIMESTRSYRDAVMYPPNQAFIGNVTPESLRDVAEPWHEQEFPNTPLAGKYGRVVDEMLFLSLLALADIGGFFEVSDLAIEGLEKEMTRCPFFSKHLLDNVKVLPFHEIVEKCFEDETVLAIRSGGELIGCFNRDNRAQGAEDDNLIAHYLLESYCTKASGAFAIKELCHRAKIDPDKIEYIFSCGEEACGDRYQRGGGGVAKAMGQMAGCLNAGGIDIKNFCAAPSSAIITASAYVKAGMFDNVVVVGGGSLAKLGMKCKSFLGQGMPILDDCMGAFACLISKDDGISPIIRLEKGAIGVNPISAGNVDTNVYTNVLSKPLKALGLKFTDIDKYAPELQDPNIMQFAGAGDVATANYKKIGMMAIKAGEMERSKESLDAFAKKYGMPGFSPVQGHIPSAVPYLAHAIDNIVAGKMNRVMFVGKASLFLNRIVELYDAASFVIESNPRGGEDG